MDLKQQLITAHQAMSGFEIPMMPTEIIELQRIFHETEYPDMSEVVEILERNTVLSGELIKVANEPGFSHPNAEQILTIKNAVDAIGVGRLKNLVVSLGFKAQVTGSVFDEIIDHTVDVGRVAAALSEWVDDVSADEAYMAGLFHNAGAIILAMRYPVYEKYFMNSITNCYSCIPAEVKKFKVSHGVYGLLVSKKWELEAIYAQVLLMHHQRDLSKLKNDKVRALVALVQLAGCIVSEVSFDNYIGTEVKDMHASAQNELLLSSDVVDEIRLSVMANSI